MTEICNRLLEKIKGDSHLNRQLTRLLTEDTVDDVQNDTWFSQSHGSPVNIRSE